LKNYLAVLKLKKEIKRKKEKTKKFRKIEDSEIISYFTSEFHFPKNLVEGKKRSTISKIIEKLSRKVIKIISTNKISYQKLMKGENFILRG